MLVSVRSRGLKCFFALPLLVDLVLFGFIGFHRGFIVFFVFFLVRNGFE